MPFGVAVGMLLHMGMPDALPVGDSGLLELAVRSAMHGEQFTGSYSRFGFHHPGPVYFYIQTVPYWLSGGTTVALHLTAICLNGISVGSIVWVLWRTLPGTAFWFSLVTLSLYCMFLGQFLIEYWDPAVTILPFVFLLLCCAGVMNGDTRLIGPASLAGTFVAQSQLTYVPTVLLVAGVTALCRLPGPRRWLSLPESENSIGRRAAISWTIALAVLWTPTVFDQLFGSGNLANIFTAFLGNSEPSLRSFRDNYAELCLATSRFFAMPLATGADIDAEVSVVATHVVLILQLGVLIVGGMAFGRRPLIRCLSMLGLACFAAFLFSIQSIKGQFHFHITLWMSCVGLVTLLVAGLMVAASFRDRFAGKPRAIVITILAMICGFLAYHNSKMNVYYTVLARWQHGTAPSSTLIRSSRDETVRALEHDRGRPIAVRVEPASMWYGASGLVLLLAREGFDARAIGPHEVRFPMRYRLTAADGDAAELLLIVDERDPGPGYALLGSSGLMRLYKRH
jgi:hypothetical protein